MPKPPISTPVRSRRPRILQTSAADLFEIQSLESRLLFSANTTAITDPTLSAAAITGLQSGLSEVVKMGGALDDYGALGDNLAGVGQSVGDLFDFGSLDGSSGFLKTEFAQPLISALVANVTKASDVTAILDALDKPEVGGNSVTVQSVTGGYYAATGEFEWDFVLKGKRSDTLAFAPGSDLAAEGLSISGNSNVTIATTADFHLSIGVKADGTGFFITLTDLDFAASADTGNTLNFNVGFDAGGSLGVANGRVQLAAQLPDVTFPLVTPGVGGRIGGAQLTTLSNGLAVGEVSLGTVTSSLHSTLPLTLGAPGLLTVLIDDTNLLDATAPDVQLKYYLTDAGLRGNILDILGSLDGQISTITGNAIFDQKIPLLDKTIGDFLPAADFDTLLSFRDVANTYFGSTASPELGGLIDALTTHLSTLGTLAGSAIDFVFDAAQKNFSVDFQLDATASVTTGVKLPSFGDASTTLGINLPNDVLLTVSGSAKAYFTVGLDLSSGSVGANSAYVVVDEISAGASVSATGLNFGVNIGPMGASVVGGTVNLSAKGSVSFSDPNSDGRITLAEFAGTTVTLTPSGSIDVNLPLQLTFGGYNFKEAGVDPYLHLSSANPFTLPVTVDVNTPNFSRLFNLGKMGPEQVLDLMIAAGDWATQFRDADIFDVEIPFLENVDLGDSFDFGLLFAKNLRDQLSNNEAQLFASKTSATLASAETFVLQLDDDAANSKAITIAAGTYANATALVQALNTAIIAAYGATPPIHAVLEDGPDKKPATGDERVMLGSATSEGQGFSLVGSFSDLKDLGFYTGSTLATFTASADAAASGKLSGDATLGVSINGAAPISFTIAKTATDANSSVADLAVDVQAALTAAGLTTLTVTATGNKLVFTGSSTVKAFMVVGSGDTKWSELGLDEEMQGGLGGIGSVLKTDAKFATFQELVPLLASALGIPEGVISPSYDPATETVKLHVKFGYNPDPIQVPVGFNLNLGDLASVKTVDADGKEAPLTITLTPKLNAELDFGYTFKPVLVAESLKVAPDPGYVSPAGYLEETATPATWNGRLSADATFTVLLDNAKSYTLTVTQAATSGNNSAADLVADLNTAIAATTGLAGKITATLLPASGETAARVQIATVAGTSRLLQIKTTTSDAAHTELGFGLDSFSQASDQGLTALNLSGQTVKYAPGADAHFSVSIDDATPVTITLAKTATDANTSLADLLTDINAAISNAGLGAKLQATRFGAGDRIQFTVLGDARSLRFDTDTADAAHTKLGFSDEAIYQRLRGGEFFMENVKVNGEATLAVEDLRLAAQLGFIGIKTGDSGGSMTIGVDVELKQGANTRFTIGSLFNAVAQDGIASIVEITKYGSANFQLTDITIDAGLFTLPASPTVSFVVSDLFASNLVITPVFTNMPSLPNFSKLDFTTIFLGVKQAVDILANYDDFAFLNYHLPIVNLSVVEMFDYADQLRVEVEKLQNDPAAALQLVETTIEEALGLPPSLVTLSIDGPGLDAIKISIVLQKDYSDTLGLNLDLNDLGALFDGALATGWETLSSVIDASAEGNIKVAAYAKAQIDFGVDLTGATARPFLYDTSGVEVGFRLAGTNLNLNASIGIVGLAISGGTVLLDSDGVFDQFDKNGAFIAGGDGVIDNDFATIRLGLKDNAEPGSPNDGRHYFTESFTFDDDFGVTYQGQFKAVLPVSLITPLGNFDLDVPIELTTSAPDFAALIQRLPGIKPIHITLPTLEGLLPEVPGLIQLIRDPSILLGGIDNVLYKIQQGLDSQTAQKLPLIGSRLGEGAQMIEEFREGFLAELTEKVRGAGDSLLADLQEMMFDFFGPTGDLDILADLNGDSAITIDDVVLSFRKADGSLWVEGTDAPKLQEAIEFNLRLGQEYKANIPDLQLDFALPGLELNLSGSPEVSFDWNMYLGFGVSLSDLFYVNTKPTTDGLPKNATNDYVAAELEANFNVRLTSDEANPFTATGTLFFLQLQATDEKLTADNKTSGGPLGYSLFNGKFTVNLNDPGIGAAADEHLTYPELFKRSGPIKVIEAGLSATADINLDLNLSVQGSKVIPRILADFNLDWSWEYGVGASPVKAGFNNVALDLGSFISDFLKPVCDQINGIIKPFDPVLDALQTRIPVLSDLMGRDYTLLDLAVTFGKVDRRFIDAALQIRALIADIAAMPAGQSIIIPMGSIADFGSALTAKGGTKNYDPTAAGISNSSADISSAPASAQNIVTKSKSVSGGGFAFPILKPANVFKLLMGQDVVLFTYDIPRLEVGMSMSAKFSIFGPLVATFKGSITAYADFAVGFDTKGLNQFKVSGDVTDIIDGFYVSDRENADGTGADVPEAGMVGRIDIGGAVNLAIVEAGISGFFQLSATLDLNDPNDDGKIRGSEIIALLKYKTPDGKSYGPLNLASITLKGEVGARAYVDVFALFSWETVWEYEFFRATIFEKTFSAPRPVPTLAEVASDGTLQINAGTSANKRAFGSTTDVGESFTLTQLSNGDIKVRFDNTETEQVLSGVKKIVFSSGKGNDVLDARGLDVPVEFDGGEGDDVLYAGNAGSTLIGGLGNDEIHGGTGIDIIFGGSGSDIIIGGEGDDIIDGGEGNDDIDTGLGNDVLKFADNWGVDSITFLGGALGATEANRDAFDFSAASAGLTISVGTNQSKVVAGKNSVTVDDEVGELRRITGGSGNDAVNINSSSPLGITLDGGKGADTYSIGLGRINGLVTITDGGGSPSDDDTVVVAPVANDPISLYDAKLILNKTTTNEQVNFTGIESLTVDAAKSAVRVEEALTFDNNVRLKGSTVAVKNSIDGGYIRLDSGNAIKIDADLNAHADGNIEVVVAKGDIDINSNIWSSTNKTGGATGTGAGVIQLVSRNGQIVTDSTGTVRADNGYLLLQGGKGGIGTDAAPILTQVATLAGITTGDGVVNIHEADGLIVGEVSIIAGLTSNGGNITITNDDNSLTFNSPASAKGGDMVFSSDEVQVNAALTSAMGNLLLQPLHTTTEIAIGDGVDKTFDLDTSEVGLLTDGFDSVKIGRIDGLHHVFIEDITFTDPTYIQNPVLGGHVYQTGKITGVGNASLTILGSGHTTDLDNQDVVAGNIDILDSGRVRAGESIRLEADAGNININFDLDGAGAGTTEKLTLNAPNGSITIKGNVGTLNIIDELIIENALNVRFEGDVKVGKLIIMNAGTFTVDGAVIADTIDLQTVGTVDFNSSITATSITHTTGTLGVATFEGAVNTPTISISATSLIDFYQNVDTGALTLSTTGLTGDILLRQQLNATGLVSVQSLDDITFQGPVTAANVTVANVNDLAFQSTLNISGTLTQTTGSGVSSFSSVTVGSADVTAAALVFNSSLTSSNAAGTIALHATAGDLSITGVTNVANVFNATASGNLTFLGNATGKTVSLDATNVTYGNLTATTGGSLTLKAAITGTITGTGATNSAGALTISRAANVSLAGAITVNGAFTQSEALGFATGTTSLGQVNAASIDLHATHLSFSGTVTATTGGVTLKAGAAGNISVSGALTANSGALAVTQAGSVTFSAQVDAQSANIASAQFIIVANSAAFTTTGAATLITTDTTVGEIKLTGSLAAGGIATITGARALSFLGSVEAASGTFTAATTINLGTGSVTTTSGDLALITTNAGAGNGVTASGPIDIADDFTIVTPRAVTLNGSLEAATVSIDAAAITLPGTVETTGALTLLAANTGNISLSSTVNAGGALTINRVRDLTFGGLVTADSISVGATEARVITVGTSGLSTTNDLSLRSTAATGSLAINGPLTSADGTVTLSAIGSVTTSAALNANRIVASGANLTFNGALTADGVSPGVNGVVIDTATAATGSVSFGSTLTSAADVTIGATKRPQTVTLSGTVNVTGDLAITSAETITANSGVTAGHDLAITTTSPAVGEVRLVGAVSAAHDLRLSAARDAFFQAVVGVGHDLIITAVDDVQFQAALTVTNSLDQQAGTGTANYASILAGVVEVNAANIAVSNGLTTTISDATFNSGATGDINIGGTVSVAGELEVELADDVTITNSVTANAVLIGSTQVRTITFGNGGVLSTNAITLNATAANGLISAGGALTSVNGILTANTTGTLNALGAVKADRVVATAASMTFSSTLEADGTGANQGIVLDAVTAGAGSFSLASTVTSSDSITIGATKRPASVVFQGGIGAANDLTVTAAETITLTGAVNVTDDVTLTTTSTTAGEVRALSTVNINGDLTLSAARDATFQAAVTVLGNATVTTADDLQFQATLTVSGTLTQDTGTGVSSFGNVLAGHVDLEAKSLQVSGSLTSQLGAIQLTATGGSVTVTGATTSAAALIVQDGVTVTFSGKATATQMLLKGGSLIASNDLIATTGSITILSTGDVTVGGETRAALDEIVIDGSEDVTLQGAVTAETITIDVTSLNAAGTVSATAGDLRLTTIGDIAITGATTASGSIEVTQAQSVTLSGAVSASDFKLTAASFLAGNTLTTTLADVDLTTTGNIRVVGLATIARDLIIRGAANVTFQGQSLVTGKIQQIDGTATTRFEGVAQAASISLKTAQQILAGSTFRALTGDIVLESDEIDFVGGTNTVQGNAQLILRSYLAATTIDIGSPTPTGTLDLSDVDINALRDGFTQIIIGRSEDATGAMLIGSSVFKDNLALHAGSIVVESNTLVGQQVSTLESLEMTARTGSITTNDDVDATDIALTARDNVTANSTVQGQDFVTVIAGTDGGGNVTVTATGTLEGTATGSDVTITTGATSGDLNVAGLISAKDDVTLTAASGAITQTAGTTIAADLVATAKSGITLLTTVDHIKARVTAAGDIFITDNNPDLTHVLVLGSKTDVTDGLFTADGDIHVTANANGSAFRVEATGGIFLNFGGEVFVGTVNGAPSQITGTILLDEDRTTNGEDITFNGNIRLLRDITLTSNGGNITITGRVSGTVGSNYGLTLDAGIGDVLVGGPIGFDVLSAAPLSFLKVISADEVTFGDEATDLAAIRVLGDIEIHSNDVEFNSPASSVVTLNGGALKLFPMTTTAAIDIGAPLAGTADYALGDDDLRALGDSFSLITIGTAGGTHDITLESAQFRDSLVLNGDHVSFLTSSTPQSVTGLSVVNGSDDNSITINAQSQFTQGRRAAISAGRYGNITITADVMELDGLSANLIRGFGTLTLQPFTATQAITLGSAGAAGDFDLTVGELATLADGFRSITLGRADGEHAIVIDASLTFRDSTTIQAPVGAGSIAFGNANAATKLRTTGKGDTLTLKAAGDVTIDGSLSTTGAGALTVIADADASGAGDLLIGQNLNAKNLTLAFTTEQGAQSLRGENVRISTVVPAKAKFGAVTLTAKTGNLTIAANLDDDGDGSVEIRHLKSVLNTAGLLTIGGDTASILVESARLTALAGLDLSAEGSIDLTTKSTLQSNLFANLTAGGNLSILTGTKLAVKTGSFQLRADRDDATDDGNLGLLTLGDGISITSKTTGLLSAFQIQRSAKAAVKATTLTLDQG